MQVPVGTRMRFLQAVPPEGWTVITRHRLYIVCEKMPEGGEQLLMDFGGEQLVQQKRVA
jgi:hypothetical protein